jgi:hypothetical protein
MSAINGNLNAFNEVIDSADYWVTVYGFTPEDRGMIMNVFSRHGNIVSHNVPQLGSYPRLFCMLNKHSSATATSWTID